MWQTGCTFWLGEGTLTRPHIGASACARRKGGREQHLDQSSQSKELTGDPDTALMRQNSTHTQYNELQTHSFTVNYVRQGFFTSKWLTEEQGPWVTGTGMED
ncbi:hypothetical protein SKAU_G00108420 [Synaphobranchus kaupii]|uniref:Uncharacterized protein n=1 Tax=Synaphobranchus kaupii TaxID=118154 RepID=A0A9Q1G0M2_SYNKA|nr:hypothetical protein SKAU_G00108420 [Synaphobranchus kaupii]